MKVLLYNFSTVLLTGLMVVASSGCDRKNKSTATDEPPRMIETGTPISNDQDKAPVADSPSAPVAKADEGALDDPAPPSEGASGPNIPLPEGMPTTGTVFNIPIPGTTLEVSAGRFWNVLLPPRYHLISYATNKTYEGPSAFEYGQIMDDPLTRSPFCDSGASENGGIMTVPDGLGIPHAYCVRYFNSEIGFREVAGSHRGANHVEFSSPAEDPATYERFYFATHDALDPEDMGTPALTRFESFCASNYNEGTVSMAIINNWWNDPLQPRPVLVRWCQTQIGGGFRRPLDTWVAGFFFEEDMGASGNAAHATVEMTFVASAAGIPSAFRPEVFLRGAAYRVRSMLVQTGLNAPFNNFTP